MTAQQRGNRLLETLARVNRTKVFLAVLAIAAVGLFLPDLLGAVLIYALVAAMAGLLATTWPVTPIPMRIARLAILALLAAMATTKIL